MGLCDLVADLPLVRTVKIMYNIDPNYRYRYDEKVLAFLRKIKETGGYPGEVNDEMFKVIDGYFTTVELSPYTGLRLQWHLTKNGRESLRWDNYKKRHKERSKVESEKRDRRRKQDEFAVRPLTIEVLDALKAILDNGHPDTEKLDVLARIQRAGGGGYYQKQWIADGPWAELKDGEWKLTSLGREAAVAHIRKTDCAQFTGKVR